MTPNLEWRVWNRQGGRDSAERLASCFRWCQGTASTQAEGGGLPAIGLPPMQWGIGTIARGLSCCLQCFQWVPVPGSRARGAAETRAVLLSPRATVSRQLSTSMFAARKCDSEGPDGNQGRYHAGRRASSAAASFHRRQQYVRASRRHIRRLPSHAETCRALRRRCSGNAALTPVLSTHRATLQWQRVSADWHLVIRCHNPQ